MKHLFWVERDRVYHTRSAIKPTIAEAIELAGKENRLITFDFSHIRVSVMPYSNPDLIERDFNRAFYGYIGRNVGPSPKETLTEEDLAADATIAAVKERVRLEQEKMQAERVTAARAVLESCLKDAPAIEVVDPADWESIKHKPELDAMSLDLIGVAEAWARLMQKAVAPSGNLDRSIAERTLKLADSGNELSGAGLKWIIGLLAMHWSHGKQLQRMFSEEPL